MSVVDFPESSSRFHVRKPPDRSRVDACPGALQTHPAADGAVARIRVPGGVLTAAQLRELGAAATSLGSGVVELTSRANVQVRGLNAEGETAFAARMAAAGLLPSATHERVRNILASPMAGLDGRGLIEVAPLVRELDEALCSRPALAGLPGRFLFALDDGRGDLPALKADLTFVPIPAPAGGEPVEGALLLAGEDHGVRLAPTQAVSAMMAAAEAFLAERTAQNSTAWRMAELDDGPARIATHLGGSARVGTPAHADGPTGSGEHGPVPVVSPDVPSSPPLGLVHRPARGAVPGPGERAVPRVALVVMPPLGRLTGAQARALATAAQAGDGEIRLTPWRGAVVPGVSGADAESWLSRLAATGLVTDPASPWTGVTACTGRPGCAKSLSDVQADAASIAHIQATTARAPGAGVLRVHWAGCERRCGRPAGQAVLVVATGDGYRVDAGGRSLHCEDIEETTAAVTAARQVAGTSRRSGA
ncbi:precorrin-3B synthase [Sphaerisporangium sp. NPDC049002]|uniref:precorrin-3B synthase n=1 Tax=Sphaerisporangium sp. NPDC049002 TaxID=3155392 RepID=UPI0033E44849